MAVVWEARWNKAAAGWLGGGKKRTDCCCCCCSRYAATAAAEGEAICLHEGRAGITSRASALIWTISMNPDRGQNAAAGVPGGTRDDATSVRLAPVAGHLHPTDHLYSSDCGMTEWRTALV